jgi:predicted membrane-bound dolichyl-phosphate-mannose-protein mannosyltransferase
MEDNGLKFTKSVIAGLVIAVLAGVTLGFILYQNAESLSRSCSGASCYVSDEVYYVNVARKILISIFGYNGSSWWPSSSSIKPDYYNLEHPPLAKYIIGLSMIILGDRPVCWRIPSVLLTATIPVLIYISIVRYIKGVIGVLAGIIAVTAFLFDPVVQTMGSLAMLDPYLAFFSALTFALAVHERKTLTGISLGLTLSVKYSGYFLAPFIYVLLRLKGERPVKTLYYTVLIPALVLILLNIPIILHFGLNNWINQSLVGAVEWHTTSRGPGPPASSPWGWLLNSNYFIMSFNPFRYPAVVNSVVYLIAILGAVILIPLYLPGGKFYSIGALLSIWFGYVLTFIAGNHTLYSFYTIQLSPFAALAFTEIFVTLYMLSEGKLAPIYKEHVKPYSDVLIRGRLDKLPEEFSILPWFTLDGYRQALLISMIVFAGGLVFLKNPGFLNDYTGIGYIVNNGYPSDPVRSGIYNLLFASILFPIVLQFYKPFVEFDNKITPATLLLISGILLSSYNVNSIISPLLLLSILYIYKNRFLGLYMIGLSAYSPPVMLGILLSSIMLPWKYFVIVLAGMLSGLGLVIVSNGMSGLLDNLSYTFYYRNSMNIYNLVGGLTPQLQLVMLVAGSIISFLLIMRYRKHLPTRKILLIDDFIVLSMLSSIIIYSTTNMFSPDRVAPLLVVLAIYRVFNKGAYGFYSALTGLLGVIAVYIIPYSGEIMKVLFKYTPRNGLDIYAIHNIIGYIFQILLTLIVLFKIGAYCSGSSKRMVKETGSKR